MLYAIPGGAQVPDLPTPTTAARTQPVIESVVVSTMSPRRESVWFTLMMVGVLVTVTTGMMGVGLTLHHLGAGHLTAAFTTGALTTAVSVTVFRAATWVLDRATDWCLR